MTWVGTGIDRPAHTGFETHFLVAQTRVTWRNPTFSRKIIWFSSSRYCFIESEPFDGEARPPGPAQKSVEASMKRQITSALIEVRLFTTKLELWKSSSCSGGYPYFESFQYKILNALEISLATPAANNYKGKRKISKRCRIILRLNKHLGWSGSHIWSSSNVGRYPELWGLAEPSDWTWKVLAAAGGSLGCNKSTIINRVVPYGGSNNETYY